MLDEAEVDGVGGDSKSMQETVTKPDESKVHEVEDSLPNGC